MFLTVDELELASKRRRPSAQLEWAIRRGFVESARMTDADGRPLVLRALFDPSAELPKAQPNFGALHGPEQA